MSPALNLVLQNPAVWRGSDCARVTLPSVPTGFAELDAWLPGGGWPAGAITEIHVERTGIGELQLVMPAAARLTRSGRWLALIRSEEHTSELQSLRHLVCRLLLEKK